MTKLLLFPSLPALKPEYSAAWLGETTVLFFSPWDHVEVGVPQRETFERFVRNLNGKHTLDRLAELSGLSGLEIKHWIIYLSLKNLLQQGPAVPLRLPAPATEIPVPANSTLKPCLFLIPEAWQPELRALARQAGFKNFTMGSWQDINRLPDTFELLMAIHEGSPPPDWDRLAALKLPVLTGIYRSLELIAGPLFLPGGPCVRCFRLREAEARLISGNRYLRTALIEHHGPLEAKRRKLLMRILLNAAAEFCTSGKSSLRHKALVLNYKNPAGRKETFLPQPGCPFCGQAPEHPGLQPPKHFPALFTGSVYPYTPAQTLRGTRSVTGRFGLVPYIRTVSAKTLVPVVRAYSAAPAGQAFDLEHVGKGLTVNAARASAIGEAVERYCAKRHGRPAFLSLSWREALDSGYAPAALVPGENFKARFTPESRLAWVWGYNLSRNKPCLVPADMVFLAPLTGKGIVRLADPTSTGLGAGATLEEAIVHGILEVVEKDAWVIMERQQLTLPDVELDAGHPGLLKLLARMAKASIRIWAKYLTLDLDIPVMGALILQDRGPEIQFAYACGAHPDSEQALLQALLECAQMFPVPLGRWQEAHPGYSLGHRMQPGRHKLSLSSLPRCSALELGAQAQTCLLKLQNKNLDVLYVDLSQPGIPLKVARVIIPGLQPLYSPKSPYFTRRLFELPRQTGYTRKLTVPQDLYPGELLGLRALPDANP